MTDHARSDGEPTLSFDERGELLVAWTSWREGSFADGNYQIYARRAGGEPFAVSVSGAADASPRLVRCPEGLALVWTEHYFPTRTNGELTSVAYDRWADKSYRVAWLNENGQFDEPLAVRVGGGARLVSDRATPVAGRDSRRAC